MTEPTVDVLADLRNVARLYDVDLTQTIAAVAELIEALGAIPERPSAPITSDEWAQDDESLGFSHAFFGRAIRSCRSKAYERGLEKGRRLRAALARVGGA